MKNIYKIILTTLTTAIISTSALAGPNDRYHGNERPQPMHQGKSNAHWQGQGPKGAPQQPPRHHQANQPRPHAAQHAQHWQVQHQLPKMYQNSSYRVSSYQRHQLSKPDRNQQWYKVNGYYLLTDKHTDRIVKIVRA